MDSPPLSDEWLKNCRSMKNKLIWLSGLLIILAICPLFTVFGDNVLKTISVTYRNITIMANQKVIKSEQEPFIFEGRTYVPLRTLGEALNKIVEWDALKNQVIVSDKEPNKNFLCFPLHSIGERVEAMPYALTINLVDKAVPDLEGKEWLYVNLSFEFLSSEKLFWEWHAFSLFDDQGNRLKYLGNPSTPLIPKNWKGNIACRYDETIKNKHLYLVFAPYNQKYDAVHSDLTKINCFLVFDLGIMEN